MGFGRVLWSGARDQVLPQPVNGWLETVHPRFRTPWVACLVMAAAGAVSLFSSAITGLVTLMGVITLVFMGLMCVAAIRIRLMRDAPRALPHAAVAVRAGRRARVVRAHGDRPDRQGPRHRPGHGRHRHRLLCRLPAAALADQVGHAGRGRGARRVARSRPVARRGRGDRRACRGSGPAGGARRRRFDAASASRASGATSSWPATGPGGRPRGRTAALERVRPPSLAARRHAGSHQAGRGAAAWRSPWSTRARACRSTARASAWAASSTRRASGGAPARRRPTARYALIRCSADEVEIVADIAASRGVWYYHDDDVFLASSSQRCPGGPSGRLRAGARRPSPGW